MEEASNSGRRGSRMLLAVLALLVALFALLWLVWGFRWPPTAEVVAQPDPEEERRVELEGSDEAPAAP